MTFNPNYVPWMSILGVIGAGIGYVISSSGAVQQDIIPVLYGLAIGSMVGVLIRIVLRVRR